MNPRQLQLTQLGLAFGILLALVIAPQTRWLVRLPLLLPSALPGRDGALRQKIVVAHPADFQIQLAGQPDGPGLTPLEYDRSLISKFPGSAALRAKILRDATTREVRLHRDENNLLEGQPATPFRPGPNDPAPSPAQLTAFDADAAAGERLDPGNAYFPFLRAVGLFAAHRDADGMAAVQRASARPVWNEYLTEEVEGHWRINRQIYGGQEALSAAAVSAAVLFPQYEQLRHAARVAVYQAVLDEQAGRPDAGLAKREAVMRCGELMEAQATTLIGNIVGGAIVSTAQVRPGGGPQPLRVPRLTNEQRAQAALERFCAYAAQIGHPEVAVRARADAQIWQQIHRASAKIEEYAFGNGLAALLRVAIALGVDVTLLPNILSVFVLGLIAAWLARLPRLERQEPLPPGAATGFWGAVVLGLLLTALFVGAGPSAFWAFAALVVAAPIVLIAVFALVLPRLRRRIAAGLMAASITAGVALLLGLAASWQGPVLAWLVLAWLVLCLAVPVLLVSIWSMIALVKHVPFSVQVVGGFRAVMPTLVLALMLVYGGLTLWTVQQEARANYGLEQSLHGEGQYLAQLAGMAWPKE